MRNRKKPLAKDNNKYIPPIFKDKYKASFKEVTDTEPIKLSTVSLT
jgi:hypothetical protein